jgi:hypothetical protein
MPQRQCEVALAKIETVLQPQARKSAYSKPSAADCSLPAKPGNSAQSGGREGASPRSTAGRSSQPARRPANSFALS